jgi:LCP family protein required for cell wall assembly
MFEQLDDADGFEVGGSFFAATSRRFDRHRRRRTGARVAGGTACVAVAAPAFFGAFQSHHVHGTPQTKITSVGDTTIDATVDTTTVEATTPLGSSPADTFPRADPTAVNFLIVGTDNGSCFGSDMRTDTIMVVRLDPTSHRAALLSFPRDLWVDIPGGGRGRINSTYRANDPQLLIDTLEAEFRVNIDHFIQLDYCGFKNLVDSIGGVTVPVAYPLRDKNTGLLIPDAGCAVFDGGTALAYVRSRHVEYQDAAGDWHEDPSSDLGRIARQQDFMERILQSASSAGVLHPQTISALYAAYRDDMVVDTGLTIAKMIEFVGAINDVRRADIHNYQIEAKGKIIAGSDVLVWNKDSVSNTVILNIFRGLAPLGLPQPEVGAPTNSEAVVVDAPPDNAPTSAIVPDPTAVC